MSEATQDTLVGPDLEAASKPAASADATLAAAGPPPSSRSPAALELQRGDSVSRYVILSRLGAGAMGVVYAAYDPELDRKVALKLMRPGFLEGVGRREGLHQHRRCENGETR